MALVPRFTKISILFLALAASVWAQPRLRLSTTAVGPLTFAQGGVAPGQTIEARNAGSGNLTLTLSADVPWMSAVLGAARPCTVLTGTCLPINIGFTTTALARGTYTGTLTVRDPNAIDAPQFVTVTIQAGGGVPDRVDFFLPPTGGSSEVAFTTNSALQSNVTTTSGGSWLSLALDGSGTFRFTFPYRIVGRQIPSTPVGVYQGSVTTTGSNFAGDNRTIPVTLNVTAQPIASASTANLRFRVPQAGKLSQFLVMSNRGQGTLAVSGATFAPGATGGPWLTLTPDTSNSALIKADADAGTLALGTYTGTITVNSNAANGPTRVPATLEVIAAGPPLASVGSVLNIGTYARGESLAQGGATAIFGEQFVALGTAPAGAQATPYPKTISGVQVFVNDVAAPLYYVSYDQVNFLIPYETPPGDAVIRVDRAGQRGNSVSVTIERRVPRIMTFSFPGEYGIIVNATTNGYPLPTSLGIPGGAPAKPGDVLVIYAIGLGATNPAVASGDASPSSPLAAVQPNPVVVFGTPGPFSLRTAEPFFAGLVPGFMGLYQVNVVVPAGVATGDSVPISLGIESFTSNTARIALAAQ
ncbi:MAG: hypothetical protein K2X03_01940 [Bryobacteraceae bacterium]|nr:hypothetical protein [Bryobacteraceae bacterium]